MRFKFISLLFIILTVWTIGCYGQLNESISNCYLRLSDNNLVLGNALIEKNWIVENNLLIPVQFINKSSEVNYICDHHFVNSQEAGSISILINSEIIPSNDVEPSQIKIIVMTDYIDYEMKSVITVFNNVPAIREQTFYKKKSEGTPEWDLAAKNIDAFELPHIHHTLTAVNFYDRTDVNNNLVHKKSFLPYTRFIREMGNILLAESNFDKNAVFVLKEAPCPFVQLNYTGYDFEVVNKHVSVTGTGLTWNDLIRDEWVNSYSTVVGVSNENQPILFSLRSYQKAINGLDSEKDNMIMMNTWGDRNRDASINEAFCIKEIDACVKYGFTHFQVDDGWQAGLSKNSASKTGKSWSHWQAGSWQPHPERFPNGFERVVDYAESKGIQMGLWFNPSSYHHYENWERDAATIIGLHQKYGIKYFKIDGIKLPEKRAEINLRNMFSKVLAATNNAVIFNLDATADSRGGYHYFNEFGNIFLENRYTDWSNYYPHWSLRNLWQLSEFVQPELFQIEFLNHWRNKDNYPENDPLKPQAIPFDYTFAITMAAQPLAWFEGSNLPDEAESIIPLVNQYKSVWKKMHDGYTFPIGDEPDGTSWTGFQTITNENSGYFVIFRELNSENRSFIKTYLKMNTNVALNKVLGQGESFECQTDADGRIQFNLPEKFNYVIYQYEI